jgi:hypothetical protein
MEIKYYKDLILNAQHQYNQMLHNICDDLEAERDYLGQKLEIRKDRLWYRNSDLDATELTQLENELTKKYEMRLGKLVLKYSKKTQLAELLYDIAVGSINYNKQYAIHIALNGTGPII